MKHNNNNDNNTDNDDDDDDDGKSPINRRDEVSYFLYHNGSSF